jgi:hypothetical protein
LLDYRRPYGVVCGQGAWCYEQDGRRFDHAGIEIPEAPDNPVEPGPVERKPKRKPALSAVEGAT